MLDQSEQIHLEIQIFDNFLDKFLGNEARRWNFSASETHLHYKDSLVMEGSYQ